MRIPKWAKKCPNCGQISYATREHPAWSCPVCVTDLKREKASEIHKEKFVMFRPKPNGQQVHRYLSGWVTRCSECGEAVYDTRCHEAFWESWWAKSVNEYVWVIHDCIIKHINRQMEDSYRKRYCPNCHIGLPIEHSNVCDYCGQKLK